MEDLHRLRPPAFLRARVPCQLVGEPGDVDRAVYPAEVLRDRRLRFARRRLRRPGPVPAARGDADADYSHRRQGQRGHTELGHEHGPQGPLLPAAATSAETIPAGRRQRPASVTPTPSPDRRGSPATSAHCADASLVRSTASDPADSAAPRLVSRAASRARPRVSRPESVPRGGRAATRGLLVRLFPLPGSTAPPPSGISPGGGRARRRAARAGRPRPASVSRRPASGRLERRYSRPPSDVRDDPRPHRDPEPPPHAATARSGRGRARSPGPVRAPGRGTSPGRHPRRRAGRRAAVRQTLQHHRPEPMDQSTSNAASSPLATNRSSNSPSVRPGRSPRRGKRRWNVAQDRIGRYHLHHRAAFGLGSRRFSTRLLPARGRFPTDFPPIRPGGVAGRKAGSDAGAKAVWRPGRIVPGSPGPRSSLRKRLEEAAEMAGSPTAEVSPRSA